MRIVSALFTHLGKVNEKNEDNFYYHGTILNDVEREMYIDEQNSLLDEQGVFFSVFDGMGGMSAGEKASYIAASVAKKQFESPNSDNIEELFLAFCKRANYQICEEMLTSKKKMGSTVAMLHLSNMDYNVCNIGDSPVYLYRNGILSMISVEHNEREMYERIYGVVSEKKKFNLTQHLGIFDDEMSIEPYIASGKVKLGDKFLLCSDGLSDLVNFESISNIMDESIPADEIARLLLDKALANGGHDNITMICMEIID